MSELSDKYYSKEELLAIAQQQQIPKEYYEEFVVFIEEDIRKMTESGDFEDIDIGESALHFAVQYINKIVAEMQKGHSKEWSHKYADSIEEHPHAFNNAYNAIKESDPKKAKEELKIHCRAMGGDELYTKHFIFLMENGEALSDPDRQAASYSEIYTQQIALGKSEVFAHEYADLIALGEDSDNYCLWYAKSYDESIRSGKTKEYAQILANKTGEYYSDYYVRYIEDEENDAETHEFNERNILGYMNAWEYAQQNKLDHSNKFIEFYENIYINSYYADERDYTIDEKELDIDILRKSLELFNIYKNIQEAN